MPHALPPWQDPVKQPVRVEETREWRRRALDNEFAATNGRRKAALGGMTSFSGITGVVLWFGRKVWDKILPGDAPAVILASVCILALLWLGVGVYVLMLGRRCKAIAEELMYLDARR